MFAESWVESMNGGMVRGEVRRRAVVREEGLDDQASRIDMRVRQSDRVDHPFAPSVAWAEIDEEDLVEIVVDDLAKFFGEDSFFGIGQLAFEDAQLEVISGISHGAKDFSESFWVADIVGNDVGISHGGLA